MTISLPTNGHRPAEPPAQETHRSYSLVPLYPPEDTLMLSPALGVVSVIRLAGREVHMIAQQQFSATELALLTALLDAYPHYCPYEVLLACYTNPEASEAEIASYRRRLEAAAAAGGFDQMMRPLRNTLSRARLKMQALALGVRPILETGYVLMPPRMASRPRRKEQPRCPPLVAQAHR